VGGRAVLVTGGSRGIGRAIANAFAAAGDRVAVSHRASPDAAAAVLAELPGEGHIELAADIGDPTAAEALVERAADGLGGLDVLVNNAGVRPAHDIAEVTYDEWQAAWRQTIDVNLIGVANVTFCAVRRMLADGGPGKRIVNVSSRGAFRGEPNNPAYGASKAGLNALGQSLAKRLGDRGIVVTAVAPGYVETDMTAETIRGPREDEIKAQSPFGRIARPDEVAAAVLWLASPGIEFHSGSIIDVNGASYLRT
jgi:3-oxoacyl-[acyl-carrier protein] reductase